MDRVIFTIEGQGPLDEAVPVSETETETVSDEVVDDLSDDDTPDDEMPGDGLDDMSDDGSDDASDDDASDDDASDDDMSDDDTSDDDMSDDDASDDDMSDDDASDDDGPPDHAGPPDFDAPGRIRATEVLNDLRLGGEEDDGTLEGDLDLDLFGNGKDNSLRGNSGDNVLFGAGGTDEMEGGGGADVFAFAAIGRGQSGKIKDFDTEDKIALDDQFFNVGDETVDVRTVPPGQLMRAIELGLIEYDAGTGEVFVESAGEDPLITIEGGTPDIDDVIIF